MQSPPSCCSPCCCCQLVLDAIWRYNCLARRRGMICNIKSPKVVHVTHVVTTSLDSNARNASATHSTFITVTLPVQCGRSHWVTLQRYNGITDTMCHARSMPRACGGHRKWCSYHYSKNPRIRMSVALLQAFLILFLCFCMIIFVSNHIWIDHVGLLHVLNKSWKSFLIIGRKKQLAKIDKRTSLNTTD